MSIVISLDDEQARRLHELASRLDVDPKDLARAAIANFLSKPRDEFNRAADYVMEKNRELYKRLS